VERPTTTLSAHGLKWLALEEFAETVARLDLDRARHPDQLGPGELVKDNTVRTVLRLPDPASPDGPGLYVKRFKFRDLRARLKHLLVPTKPQVEWRVCRELQRAALPTCDVLAVGHRRRFGLCREGFLISREVGGVRGLAPFLRDELQGRPPAYRTELIGELAGLTTALLDNGFYHRDYHAGNLLVGPEAPAGRRLFVLDLHSIRCRPPGRRGIERMLGMLANSTAKLGAGHEDRAAFLRAFLESWHGGPGPGEEAFALWAERLKRARTRLHRRHMRSRTRRCLVRSTMFTLERREGFLVHRRRDFPLQAALEAARRHDEAMVGHTEGVRIHRRGRRTQVSVLPCEAVPPFDVKRPAPPERLEAGQVCVKAFLRRSLGERIKDALRLRSRARSAWIAARGYHVRGVPAARPLALLESRPRLDARPDYLVVEAPPNDGSLHDLAIAGLPPGERRRRLGEAVADLFARLERAEVYHPDTKPTNLLVKQTDDGPRLYLVDLERTRFDRPFTRTHWVKCLARLNAGLPASVTLLDRMRCLRACSRGRWEARERLEVARDVYALSLTRRTAWAVPGVSR
jgi:hypothetical protein